MQVLSQLPSLHQLNLRGCPIADLPDYQAQLLQQLPMLDVLDSKKVSKSGIARSVKPAALAVQPRPKQSFGSQALKPDVPSDGTLDESHVKNQKRPLRHHIEESGAPKLKKARNESLVASTDARGVVDDRGTMKASALRYAGTQSSGDDVEVVKEGKKPEKKRKAKAERKVQQQAPVGSSRSFLADVLDSAKSDIAAKPVAKANGQHVQMPAASAKAAADDAQASGLVKVVDMQTKTKSRKVKHGTGVEHKSEKNKANGVSGSSAAELLRTGLGLDALQVGLGGSGAWE